MTLVGAQTGATNVVDRLRARIDALREGNVVREGQPRQRERVLVLEWTDPPMSAGHWTPGLVELAGGEPVLGNPGADSRAIGWDEIAAADPDVVIVAPCGFDLPRAQAAIASLPPDGARTLATLRAARARRIYAMDGNAFVNRPGPRLVDTAELFDAAIRGDVPAGSDAVAAAGVRVTPGPARSAARPRR